MTFSPTERQARYRTRLRKMGRVTVSVSMTAKTRAALKQCAAQKGVTFNAWCLLALCKAAGNP